MSTTATRTDVRLNKIGHAIDNGSCRMRAASFLWAFLSVSLIFSAPSLAENPPDKHIRLSLRDFMSNAQNAQSLITAVSVMKSRDTADKASAEYRTSWEYWTNIHGYAGEGPRAGFGSDGARKVAEIQKALLEFLTQSRHKMLPTCPYSAVSTMVYRTPPLSTHFRRKPGRPANTAVRSSLPGIACICISSSE